jgi:glycosyltransferase involved in cell wall biosynthesis
MAAAVPVVASDVGACREVLDQGRLGVLVPEKRPDALAAALEGVLLERARAREVAARAQSRAQSSFTIEAMARQYARCLRLAS